MAEIWCVASGKGGVGKTFLCSGLGTTLAKLRKKVLLIDLDLSGANLHSSLGQSLHPKSFLNILKNETELSDTIVNSGIQNLDFISGCALPDMNYELGLMKCHDLVQDLKMLKYDFIIFDLGPGASTTNLSLMNMADKNLLVTTWEQSSVDKTYNFVEKSTSLQLNLKLQIVVNMCRSGQHHSLSHIIESALQSKYGVRILSTCSVSHDNAVWQSQFSTNNNVRNFFALKPYSDVSHDFYKICKHFIAPEDLRAVS